MSETRRHPAVYFLIGIVVVVLVVLAGMTWFGANQETAMRLAFVPGHDFAEDAPSEQPDYSKAESWWISPENPALGAHTPEGVMTHKMAPIADVFFVHPTTYLNRAHWNAPLDDEKTNRYTALLSFKHQASAFNVAGRIHAPKYRQAGLGAFLEEEEGMGENGARALDLAYSDILAAFDAFVAQRDAGRPIILAGHSQGAVHVLHLLKDRFDGTELTPMLAAAYVIGWPVSIEGDIGAIEGVDACESATDTGCVVSWQSYALGGDPSGIKAWFDNARGLNGEPLAGTTMLCTNPEDWKIGGNDTRSTNMGAVVMDLTDAPLGKPIRNFTGTQCQDGILYLTDIPTTPEWLEYKWPGENFHVYDINIFYMNLRANAEARARAWTPAGAAAE
ncbi:DUF3089 domain-containing protein [Pseudokordiimonas caeni]|uniref:DUF3089 domain-containing protein n=1 Tax=Pseudokordiimonas caeni TaxID=2997908 RepID=UPI002810EAA2|nr:DUF3089 domain-containing protein [Pseudokordiimonas caeni]